MDAPSAPMSEARPSARLSGHGRGAQAEQKDAATITDHCFTPIQLSLALHGQFQVAAVAACLTHPADDGEPSSLTGSYVPEPDRIAA